MKDIIQSLLKDYFNIKMILKRTILTERKGRITINIYDDVAPNLWNMYEQGTINVNTGVGMLDFNRAKTTQEDERQRLSIQIFQYAYDALNDLGRYKEFNNLFGGIPPTIKNNHAELVSYSRRAFIFCGILTYFEYDVMEPGFDESGHMLYVKNIPKQRSDEVTDALQHMVTDEDKGG